MASRPSNRKEPVKGRVGSANTATTPLNRRPPPHTMSTQKGTYRQAANNSVSRGNTAQEHRKQQAARKQSSTSQHYSGQSARGPSSQIQDHGSTSNKPREGSATRQHGHRSLTQPHPSPPRLLPDRPQQRQNVLIEEAETQRLAQEAEAYKQRLRELKEEIKLYGQERAQNQRQIGDLQRELKNIQRDCQEVEKKRFEQERAQNQVEKKRFEQERAQLQRQIADLQRELQNSQQDSRNWRDRHEELKRENNNLKSKNQDLLTRISSMASERMRSNNPCVEDLSDPNRHSAVLAKWQALMNGEYWTLYEVALKKLPSEKNTAQFLLRIMELGFKEAQYMQNGSKAFMDLMQNQRQAQGDPSMAALLDLLMKNENFQQIVDSESRKVRKGGNATLPASAIQDFHKKIQKELRNTASDLLEKSHKFADEVLRLCFLMALQSPPMALVFDRPEDKEMDALLYEPDGDRNRPRPCIVNFVLTPPLLRYEGGPVLNKGTVELR